MTTSAGSSPRISHIQQIARRGDLSRARKLIKAELREHPRSLSTWALAYNLAQTPSEKHYCLKKILELEPDHPKIHQILQALSETQDSQNDPEIPEKEDPGKAKSGGVNLIDLFLLPLDWLFNLSLPAAFVLAITALIFAGVVYSRVNVNLLGMGGLKFDQLSMSPTRESITGPDKRWDLRFEYTGNSSFTGTIRYVGPIRLEEFRILTHDVLVTTGDFADPEMVKTDVIDHKFIWRAPYTRNPEGSINLLHILPANEDISSQLYNIKKWQEVEISGREIFDIKAYDQDGELLNTWQDFGCNTILVDSIQILQD